METRFKRLTVYRQAASLSDDLWRLIGDWDQFAKWSVGMQLVRACDSIGANIAEAYGRRTNADQGRLLLIARGSAYEAEHWITCAVKRDLMDGDFLNRVEELAKTLNGLIRSQRS